MRPPKVVLSFFMFRLIIVGLKCWVCDDDKMNGGEFLDYSRKVEIGCFCSITSFVVIQQKEDTSYLMLGSG